MIRSLISRRAPLALILAAAAAISSQGLASATLTGTASPLVPTGTVAAPVAPALVNQLNVTRAAGGAAPFIQAPGTFAVQIQSFQAGSLVGGYAVNLASTALGGVSFMDANVTLTGVDAANTTVVAMDQQIVNTTGSGGASLGRGVAYVYNTNPTTAKVTQWVLTVSGIVQVASAPTTYFTFAGTDTTPALG